MDLGFKEAAVIIQHLPFNQINQIALCLHSLTELFELIMIVFIIAVIVVVVVLAVVVGGGGDGGGVDGGRDAYFIFVTTITTGGCVKIFSQV